MPTIIATPLAIDANSYGTVAGGDTYFGTRPNSTDWTGATQTLKEQALIQATAWLDRLFDFRGYITTLEQARRWPRAGVYDSDGKTITSTTLPEMVVQATYEFALFLLKSDRFKEPDALGQGVRRVTLGSLSVEPDASQVLPYCPQHVSAMLSPMYGTLKPEASRNGSMVVRLTRS